MTTPASSTGPATDPAAGAPGSTTAAGADSGTTTADPASAGEGEGGTEVVKDAAYWEAEAAKWKGLSKKHEGRARENLTAAQKLQAIEDAAKSDLQRAEDRAAKAEAAAAESAAARFRMTAATAAGLPAEMTDMLGVGTEEEITERATTLSAAIDAEVARRMAASGFANGQAPTAAGAASLARGGRPVESLRPAGIPVSDNRPVDNNALARQMFGRS
jgi:hypothetical protein